MRQHIIDTACRLFYRHGVKTVGVDRVVAEAGIAKATLYSHFPSKETLIVAYLQARHEQILAAMRQSRLGAETVSRARVLRHFETLRTKADSPAFRGCAFMLALAENEDSVAIKQQVLAHKQAVLALFLDELPEGLLTRDALARQLALLYDGALAQVMTQRSSEPVDTAADCAATMFDAHLQGTSSESSRCCQSSVPRLGAGIHG